MTKNYQTKTKMILAMISMILIASPLLIAMPVNAGVTAIGGAPQGAPNAAIPLPSGVTPDYIVNPDPYISVRPNPVGLNQPVLVNIWVDPGPSYARYFPDYKVTFTKPDGTTDVVTMNSYAADGTSWFEYTVDQVGTWTAKFDFPGGYFPAGNYTVPPGVNMAGYTETYTKSVSYPTKTATTQFTVQQDMVASYPPAQLPTDYWTRPVQPDKREWTSILGDYPWYGPGGGSDWPADTNTYWSSTYSFVPYVQAPESAHIVWMRQGAISGLMGGQMGTFSQTSGGGTPGIIYEGRCYQSMTKVINGVSQRVRRML